MKRLLLFSLFSVLLLAACAPDPRKQAQADAIRLAAEQDAANNTQTRAQSQDMHQLDLTAKQIDVQTKSETAVQWRASVNTMIKFGFGFLTFAVCIALASTSIGYSMAVIGKGRAIASTAYSAEDVKANLIPLDPLTRQYPLLRHVHGSRFLLSNANTGQVTALDTSNDADRQMIAAMGAVQYIGVLAPQAAQSTDAAGMAMLQSPIVIARTDKLSVTVGETQ